MEGRAKHIETLLVITAGMIVFFLLTENQYFLYVGLSIAIIGLAIPFAAKYIHLGWMGIAKIMGFINSHIILGVLFFFFLTPLALIRRLIGKDQLQLKRKTVGSYFRIEERVFQGKDLENPW